MLQLSNSQKQFLLQTARRAVRRRLLGDAASEGGASADEAGAAFGEERCGVFVSIHIHGELRGCIGRIESDEPLAPTTAECAVSAAFGDPRFVPVSLAELEEAEFELSVLSALEPLEDAARVEVGRHGLFIAQHERRGLLLPQVATTYGWDRIEFLRQTSIKAGLDPDAWRSGARLWVFEAIVFSEAEL